MKTVSRSKSSSALSRCSSGESVPCPIRSGSTSRITPTNSSSSKESPLSSGRRGFLPHLPKKMAQIPPPRLAGRDDEELGDLQLQRVGVEEDEHFADEARRQGDVVVGADAA